MKSDPLLADAYVQVCTAYERAGLEDAAWACLQRAKRSAPKNRYVYVKCGEFLRRRGRPAEAERHLRKAMELDPEGHAAVYLGHVMDMRDALGIPDVDKCLRRVSRVAWDDPSILTRCGELRLLGGSHAEAERLLSRVLSLNPADASARMLLAQALLKAGAEERADALFHKAAKERKADPTHTIALGRLYLRRGMVRRAEVLFREAGRLSDARIMLLLERGLEMARGIRRPKDPDEYLRAIWMGSGPVKSRA